MMWFWVLLGLAVAFLIWPVGRAIAAWRKRRRDERALERRHVGGEINREEYERQLAELRKPGTALRSSPR